MQTLTQLYGQVYLISRNGKPNVTVYGKTRSNEWSKHFADVAKNSTSFFDKHSVEDSHLCDLCWAADAGCYED